MKESGVKAGKRSKKEKEVGGGLQTGSAAQR
jgi:hypothetical protein